MTLQRRDFTEVYNAIEVPAPITAMDAIDPDVTVIEGSFFQSVQNSLDLSMRTLSYHFEYRRSMLIPGTAGLMSGEQLHYSEDGIRIFRRRGGQALAAALYLRNDNNFQITHFIKYELQSETVDAIHDLQQLERIEFGIEE